MVLPIVFIKAQLKNSNWRGIVYKDSFFPFSPSLSVPLRSFSFQTFYFPFVCFKRTSIIGNLEQKKKFFFYQRIRSAVVVVVVAVAIFVVVAVVLVLSGGKETFALPDRHHHKH